MFSRSLVTAFLSFIIFFSCSGWQSLTIPSDPNYLFALGIADSKDKQVAIDKATLIARTEIGRQMEVNLNSLQKIFVEEIGAENDAELYQQYTSATKEVVTTQLNGSKIKEVKFREEDGIYHVESLVEYPIAQAKAALSDQIKKDKELYTRFLSSESFKEMEAEVDKLRNR